MHAEWWGNMKLLWYGCDQDKYIFDVVYGNLFTHIHIFCLWFSISLLLRYFSCLLSCTHFWTGERLLQKYIYDVANWRLLFAKFSIPFEIVNLLNDGIRHKNATDFRLFTYLNIIMNYCVCRHSSSHFDRSAVFRWIPPLRKCVDFWEDPRRTTREPKIKTVCFNIADLTLIHCFEKSWRYEQMCIRSHCLRMRNFRKVIKIVCVLLFFSSFGFEADSFRCAYVKLRDDFGVRCRKCFCVLWNRFDMARIPFKPTSLNLYDAPKTTDKKA